MQNPEVTRTAARPKGGERRKQIIDAALRVMIAEGVYNVTTRKIAEAAGVNVATLHYHFHNKEEIIFLAMEELAAGYRDTLAARFTEPQTLATRIGELLWFIWSEIEKARDEQLVLQEITLYICRIPHAEHLAGEKEREIKSLYSDLLLRCDDVAPEATAEIAELTDFVYACFVGILNQWLATRDVALLERTTTNLIEAARSLASRLLPPAPVRPGPSAHRPPGQ